MAFFSLEHSKAAYLTDFILYGIAVSCLTIFLGWSAPFLHPWPMLALLGIGLIAASLIEYLLHRFILHGLQPFRRWHQTHHARPTALIGTPTILSISLIVFFVFFPALLLGDVLQASALTLGLTTGYLFYTITHHATHHWQANSSWLKQRKIRHALHHHLDADPVFFGVTTSFWDNVFRSNVNDRMKVNQSRK